MTRIALVQPVRHGFLDAYTGSLGISYLSSFLKREGYDVGVVDMSQLEGFASTDCTTREDRAPVLVKEVCAHKPKYVGVSVMRHHVKDAADVIERIRAAGYNPTFIVGGPEATRNTREVLETTKADFAVRGGGIPAIQHVIEGNTHMPGIAQMDGHILIDRGIAGYNVSEWRIDTSTLPKDTTNGYYATVSSVGCKYRCRFCEIREMFPKVTLRSIADVVDEMETMANLMQAKRFFVGDDNFLAIPERLEELDEEMKTRGMPQKIDIVARVDSVLKAEKYLRKASQRLSGVQMGVESFVEAQLKRMGKGTTAQQNHDAIGLMRDIGVHSPIYMILADLETDYEELEAVSAVFQENLGYLLLFGHANLWDYGNGLDDYPDFIRAYRNGFSFLQTFNFTKFAAKAQKKFREGRKVPEMQKKMMGHWFRHLHDRVRQIRDGETDPMEGRIWAKSWAQNLAHSMGSLYGK